VLPTITNKPTATIDKEEAEIDVYPFAAINGSNPGGGNSTADLSWSVTGSSLFSITSSGLLQQPSGTAEGTFNLRVTVTEATGNTDYVDITVSYPTRRSIVFTPNTISSSQTGERDFVGTVVATGGAYILNANAFAASSGTSVSTTVSVLLNGEIVPESPLTASVTNFGKVTSGITIILQPGLT
jgi:hypothetical protein